MRAAAHILSIFTILLNLICSKALNLVEPSAIEEAVVVEERGTEMFSNVNYSDLTNTGNECPAGWIFEGKLCFYFNTDYSKMNLSWIDAQTECEYLGGYLAEPRVELEQDFLKSIVRIIEETTHHANWWIGLSDVSHESSWYWQHNVTPITFSSWVQGRPSDEKPNKDDCVVMFSGDQSYDWFDIKCNDLSSSFPVSFICQKANDGITTTTKTSPISTSITPTSADTTTSTYIGCDLLNGWQEFEQNCYKVFTEVIDWSDAKDRCIQENADLASIHSKSEDDFVRTLWSSSISIWLGLYWDGYDFVYDDGSDFDYSNWRSGEPDFSGCGSKGKVSGTWYDIPCSYTRNFACKRPI